MEGAHLLDSKGKSSLLLLHKVMARVRLAVHCFVWSLDQ